jgi:hypothetical protein
LDPEHREVGGDPLEVGQRCVPIHWHVRTGAGRDGQVASQDRRALRGVDLDEVDASRRPWRRTARPPAARTLRTQFPSCPSIETR